MIVIPTAVFGDEIRDVGFSSIPFTLAADSYFSLVVSHENLISDTTTVSQNGLVAPNPKRDC